MARLISCLSGNELPPVLQGKLKTIGTKKKRYIFLREINHVYFNMVTRQ
jgi:hypothetical protein